MVYPMPQWEAVEPKVAGWSEDLLEKARIYSAISGSSAVMVVHRGRVVAEWGDTHRRVDVASVRKSLLGALLGIALEEGRVKLSDTLGQLGIDDKQPSLTPTEMQATLADLLTSRSGVYHAIDLEPPAVAAQRPPRGGHAPGEFWYYNNWDFNAAGSIYEQVAGTASSTHSSNASPTPLECKISVRKPATTARPTFPTTDTMDFASARAISHASGYSTCAAAAGMTNKSSLRIGFRIASNRSKAAQRAFSGPGLWLLVVVGLCQRLCAYGDFAKEHVLRLGLRLTISFRASGPRHCHRAFG